MSEDPAATQDSQVVLGQRQTNLSADPEAIDIDAYMQVQDLGATAEDALHVGVLGEGSSKNPNAAFHGPLSPPDLEYDERTPLEKYDLITAMRPSVMTVGETWYVVSRTWFRRWQKACKGEIDKDGFVLESQLGPVNNSDIHEKGRIKNGVVEGVDVEYVSEDAWKRLVQWCVCIRSSV